MSSVALFPYAYSDAIVLGLSDFDDPVKGNPVNVVNSAEIDASEVVGPMLYDIASDDWAVLTFKMTAELSSEDLRLVLPETTDPSEDAALVVTLFCPGTRFRKPVLLRYVKTGKWVGHSSIRREDVSAELILRPQLVRVNTVPVPSEASFATARGAVLGGGSGARIRLNPSLPALHSAIDVLWEDFGNSEDLWRRAHADDVFQLEVFGEPRLYLNARYSQLRELLDSTAKRGPEAVYRDMLAALIVQPVLVQLAIAAIAGILVDEESETASPLTGWRGQLLSTVLPHLYPDEADDADRARRASLDLKDPEGVFGLAGRLGTAVQAMVSSFKLVEMIIRTHESQRLTEDGNAS